jgi:hypothetical protein
LPTLLSRDVFLQKRERKFETVQIPELGGSVRIKALTSGEQARYEASLRDRNAEFIPGRMMQNRERLIVAACVDEEGQPLFKESDVVHLHENLPCGVASKLCAAIRKVSGMDEDEKRETLEELAGNSCRPTISGGPSDTSASQPVASIG